MRGSIGEEKMDISNPHSFFENFPRLNKSPYPFTITSPSDIRYNCIAWAVGVSNLWWDPYHFWPQNCPREVTIPAFVKVLGTLGYRPCEDGRRERGYEKIVLYALGNEPTHAARQLSNGRWTSKLGKSVDIEHRIKDLEGPCYGKVAMYFRRMVENI